MNWSHFVFPAVSLKKTYSNREEDWHTSTILGDLYHFIFDICNSYHGTNPYHNFRHAVDVLQANYYFLCKMGLLKPMYPSNEFTFGHSQNPVIRLMTPLDIFALLMASIGHDVGHPGVNNNFMVIKNNNKKQKRQLNKRLTLNRSQHQHLWLSYIMINQFLKVSMLCPFSIYYKITALVN